jgi:pSer/pThr/pTyr-binding forkhead associated (FHA) protein
LQAPKAKLGLPQVSLPPLPLPPQNDRRFTIGRAMACDFTLADLSVSRWHARLYRDDEQHWLLSDLGSTNGTRLNGWRVTTGVPVKPGDQVSFGSISFVITDRLPRLG